MVIYLVEITFAEVHCDHQVLLQTGDPKVQRNQIAAAPLKGPQTMAKSRYLFAAMNYRRWMRLVAVILFVCSMLDDMANGENMEGQNVFRIATSQR